MKKLINVVLTVLLLVLVISIVGVIPDDALLDMPEILASVFGWIKDAVWTLWSLLPITS